MLSVSVLSALIPREKAGIVESPFVVVLDSIGVPYAADIMNFIILTALLSVANSGLYAATRMLYSLSKEGMASPKLGMVNKRGIPLNALLITLAIAGLSLLSSVVAAKTVFVFLLSLAGLGAQIGWIAIAASLLAFRRSYIRQGGKGRKFKIQSTTLSIHSHSCLNSKLHRHD